MGHALSGSELIAQRRPNQWSCIRLVTPSYHVIYSAVLSAVPTSADMVASISFTSGSGTLSDVRPDMTLYVGTTVGGYDLGMCRIRKSPIAGTFYIGETSEIVWQSNAKLTVVDDYQLWARPLRIVSQVPYMDWDVAYSDQHSDFDPVPAMGCDRVAKLSGASVSVALGPSDDAPPWVINGDIVSQQWTYSGPAGLTFDDDTALNPTATATAVGTYTLYCLFTADNGKSFWGVRYLIVWNDQNPPFQYLSVRNGRMNYETGSCSFDVVLYNSFTVSSLRKRSRIILSTEDYAERSAVTMPGAIPGAENILAVGWITDIDTTRQSEFGEISFTVEAAEYWMKKIRDYPSGLEFKQGTAARWTDMPALTVKKATWHFLHWRSTATRVMDVQLEEDTRYATRFNVMRSNLWERVTQITQTTIHAGMMVDNFGRLFTQIDPQMIPIDERSSIPTIMTLTDNDLEDNIAWSRRDVNEISMLFYSGVRINSTGGASSFFAMSPGHSYGHYGEEEPQDNYLVSSQEQAIEACGLYYGWKNNDPYDLQVSFIHSMRILGMCPRQYFYYEVSAENDPRGIGFAKRWIVRDINFSFEPDTGFIAFSATLEPENVAGPAIKGDVPSMENIDFSIPSLPSLPGLPSLPLLPIISLPPNILNEDQPKKVLVGSTTHGVHYTENFDANDSDIKWLSMNGGLLSGEISSIYKIIVTPSGAIYLWTTYGSGRIYRAAGLGGDFSLVVDGTDFAGGNIIAMGLNPNLSEKIAFLAGNDHDMSFVLADRYGYSIGATGIVIRNWWMGDIVYSNGKFIVAASQFGTPWMYSFTSDGSVVANNSIFTAIGQDAAVRYMNAIGTQDKVFQWDNSGAFGYNYLTSGGTVATRTAGIAWMNNPQAVAFATDGLHMMGAQSIAGVATPTNSTDGTTFNNISSVVPAGSDIWESCRDNNRWIFGGGIILRLTMDQGASYIDKYTSLAVIAPLIDIVSIRFIE